MTQTYSTLFKKTSTGAIQYWTIQVEDSPPENPGSGAIIIDYGQVGTDKPQQTTDYINVGKNIGKKNETTPYQQACAEAAAKHEKQRKQGYVDSQEKAEAGELDAIIQGGISPMLAHKFAEQGHKIVWPAYGQPKLDGMRCIAIVDEGKASLWSRERNPILSSPHLIAELERLLPTGRHEFDGELYNHDMKDRFEEFMSIVRQTDKIHPDHEKIEYWVYDIPDLELTFEERKQKLDHFFICSMLDRKFVKSVMTLPIQEDEMVDIFTHYRADKYEGLMLRNGASKYVNKRSYDLQKIKEFDDGEFAIVGIKEGRGKLLGHVGAFMCKMPDSDNTFEVKMKGDTGRLKSFFDNHSLWQGKVMTVRYQGLTKKNVVPRFPVGVTFRDYE